MFWDISHGDEAVNESSAHSGSVFSAIRAIDYTVIFARDMAAMRRFHEGVLGLSGGTRSVVEMDRVPARQQHAGAGCADANRRGCADARRAS